MTLRGCAKPPEGAAAAAAAAAVTTNLIRGVHVVFLRTTQCSFETEPFTSLHPQKKRRQTWPKIAQSGESEMTFIYCAQWPPPVRVQ